VKLDTLASITHVENAKRKVCVFRRSALTSMTELNITLHAFKGSKVLCRSQKRVNKFKINIDVNDKWN